MFLSNSLKKDLDMKMGIFWNKNKNLGTIDIFTEFTLPAKDMGREHHRWRSNLALSRAGLKLYSKRSLQFLVTVTLRYVKLSQLTLKGYCLNYINFASSLIGKSRLLAGFILYPDISPNSDIILITFGIETSGLDKYSKRSSAYSANLCVRSPLVMPCTCLAHQIVAARGSMVRSNKREESGHPCLVPLFKRKYWDNGCLRGSV